MIRILLAAFVGAAALGTLHGTADFGGVAAARSLRAWWIARQFEAAAVHEDVEGMERSARELTALGAGDGAARFAADRIGFQMTAPSWGLPPGLARMRAIQGLGLLDGRVSRSEDPWQVRLIQGIILVNRLPTAEFDPLRLAPVRDWLAAGGGPRTRSTAPGEAYRAALGLPPESRSDFLLERLRTPSRPGGNGD